jgi:hypothetical protein
VKRVLHSIAVGRALHYISMCISRVAVRASECAADIGIDGPESHPCNFGSVENVLRSGRVIPDILLLTDYRKET